MTLSRVPIEDLVEGVFDPSSGATLRVPYRPRSKYSLVLDVPHSVQRLRVAYGAMHCSLGIRHRGKTVFRMVDAQTHSSWEWTANSSNGMRSFRLTLPRWLMPVNFQHAVLLDQKPKLIAATLSLPDFDARNNDGVLQIHTLNGGHAKIEVAIDPGAF